jgi:hypothetical protein
MHLPGVKAHGYAVNHVEDYEEQPLWPVQKSTCDVRKINKQYASNPDDFPAGKTFYENDQPPLLALT